MRARYTQRMSVIRGKQTNAQTLAGVAIVLVAAALLFVVIGVSSEQFGTAIFGAILLGLAVLIGVVGIGMNSFRR